ncbi:MAG TPA: hypothetical protein VGP68_01585 [Gemmataceae bacterium]|jgi:hypothetical protein|nr:hypothetical protein [Gemmataceae bacterium]
MKTRFRSEDDGWMADGRKITAPEALEAIRRCLDEEGPIIIEHLFYRGSCAGGTVFQDFDAFAGYPETHASAGDAVHVWSFAAVCRDENERREIRGAIQTEVVVN